MQVLYYLDIVSVQAISTFPLVPHHFASHIIMVLDVEFGRIQARDMLQHLWTGPISNASVEVVQGSKSVEVRAVGVTKVISI